MIRVMAFIDGFNCYHAIKENALKFKLPDGRVVEKE